MVNNTYTNTQQGTLNKLSYYACKPQAYINMFACHKDKGLHCLYSNVECGVQIDQLKCQVF